ncbi:MAG: nucleotidyltransferase domain-containing protein [candidate division KSB1 bacterium]|nr:nucleotidyltransferase domain-containing protein [candidate division KSB1 bacterium]MDZ7365491.1 nucleotidyltransferase domain-containing protein [candidate division KSB1 bacterium]MDZ7403594.1 nucleotidyltransferase domain-containing protein [candidate division KSB1 bacterium]
MPEIQDYIESYRRRAKASRQETRLRAEKASEIALRCAEKLIEEFGAERVSLFGSLAEGRFRASSDIDLVVEGLAPAVYFKASARISRLAGEFEVDLIPFETYKYKAEVLEKGRVLYGVGNSRSSSCCN